MIAFLSVLYEQCLVECLVVLSRRKPTLSCRSKSDRRIASSYSLSYRHLVVESDSTVQLLEMWNVAL
jgi:hypothetical protein